MDKKLAAEKIRARLEKRLAAFLGCELQELPRMKLVPYVDGRGVAVSGSRDCLGHRNAEDGRDGNAKGGHQLIRELTLDQIGKEISAAIQTLTLAQRKAIGESLLSELRKPVGTLRRDG